MAASNEGNSAAVSNVAELNDVMRKKISELEVAHQRQVAQLEVNHMQRIQEMEKKLRKSQDSYAEAITCILAIKRCARAGKPVEISSIE